MTASMLINKSDADFVASSRTQNSRQSIQESCKSLCSVLPTRQKASIMTLRGSVTLQTPLIAALALCRDEAMAAKAAQAPAALQSTESPPLPQRAQHHGLIAGLAGENPAFSLAGRLAVRWVAAHLCLGCHVAPEAVELIVAAAFEHTPGAPAPGGLHGVALGVQEGCCRPWAACCWQSMHSHLYLGCHEAMRQLRL